MEQDSKAFPEKHWELLTTNKQLFYEEAFQFVMQTTSEHMWCHYPQVMIELMELFEFDQDALVKSLLEKMQSQLACCVLCVKEYHKGQQVRLARYRDQFTEESIQVFTSKLKHMDEQRIVSSLTTAKDGDAEQLSGTLFEVVNYPEYLENPKINPLFTQKLLSIQEEIVFENEGQKVPGVYMLLVHPEVGVRYWSAQMAERMGTIKGMDEFALLLPILKKLMVVLEFDIMDTGSGLITQSRKEFWAGFTRLIVKFDRDTFERGFMSEFQNFIDIVLNHLNEHLDTFWQVLRCLNTLLEILGYKLWMNTSFSPKGVCTTLMNQCLSSTEDRIHKVIFGVLEAFLASLGDYGEEEYLLQVEAVIKFLLDNVSKSNKISKEVKHIAAATAFRVLSKGYALTPPKPLSNTKIWGNYAIHQACSKDPEALVVKKPAILLLEHFIKFEIYKIRSYCDNRKPAEVVWSQSIWVNLLTNYWTSIVTFLDNANKQKPAPNSKLIEEPDVVKSLVYWIINPLHPIRERVSAFMKNQTGSGIIDTLKQLTAKFPIVLLNSFLKCLKEICFYGSRACFFSIDNMYLLFGYLLPYLHATEEALIRKESEQSKEVDAKSGSEMFSALLVKISKYLWVIFEDTLSIAKEFSGDVAFKVVTERAFKFIANCFPMFAFQYYPARLLAKRLERESAIAPDLDLNASLDADEIIQASTPTIILSHSNWFPKILGEWSRVVHKEIHEQWFAAVISILKALKESNIKLTAGEESLCNEIVKYDTVLNPGQKQQISQWSSSTAPVEKPRVIASKSSVPPALPNSAPAVAKPTPSASVFKIPSLFEPKPARKQKDNSEKKMEAEEIFSESMFDEPLHDVDNLLNELTEEASMIEYKIKMKAAPRSIKIIDSSPIKLKGAQHRALMDMKKPMTLNDLYKRVLDWNVFRLEDSAENPTISIPRSFGSVEEYISVLQPLLLEEIRSQFQRDWQEASRTPQDATLTNIQGVSEFTLVDLKLKQPPNELGFSSEDILLLSKEKIPHADGKHVLGKVEKRDPQKDKDKDQRVMRVRLYLANKKEVAKEFRQRGEWSIFKVSNISTANREYQALHGCSRLQLLPSLLSPSRPLTTSTIPEVYSKGLQDKFNGPQLAAIRACASANGFSLLQGPPGTGKTTTILGLLSVLLNSAPVALPPVVRSTAMFAKQQQNAMSQNRSAKGTKRHILVCAPSNAAVDEITLRLIKVGLWDINGQLYKPSVVRLGPPHLMSPEVRSHSLESLLEASLKQPGSTYYKEKNRAEDTKRKISELKKQLHTISSEIKQLTTDLDASVPSSDNQAKSQQLHELFKQQRVMSAKLSTLTKEDTEKGNRLDTAKKSLVDSILAEASIICCTLSGAGSEKLAQLSSFETVIIDEAAQAVELTTLIPLQYGCKRCILVGDPNQLPATVFSQTASLLLYEQSLFQRLQRCNYPIHMLTVQYRMHSEIRKFPSLHFYQDRLTDGDNVLGYKQPFYDDSKLGPYRFFDIESQENRTGSSLKNVKEAEFAVSIVKYLVSKYSGIKFADRIGIITPYRQQLHELKRQFKTELKDLAIEINTVDGYQGREKDIIIFSCVRAQPGTGKNATVGFLADVRRMNVALTRAKYCLLLIGHASSLEVNSNWKLLIDNAIQRKCYSRIHDNSSFFSELQIIGKQIQDKESRDKHRNRDDHHKHGDHSDYRHSKKPKHH